MCASMRHFLWWSCGQWRDVVVVDGVAEKSVIAVVFDDDDDGSLMERDANTEIIAVQC